MIGLYPLAPHFYIVKLGFTGVYIFLIFALKHRLWVLVRIASPNLCFAPKLEKYHIFHLKFIIFTAVKNCCILHELVFIMYHKSQVSTGSGLIPASNLRRIIFVLIHVCHK